MNNILQHAIEQCVWECVCVFVVFFLLFNFSSVLLFGKFTQRVTFCENLIKTSAAKSESKQTETNTNVNFSVRIPFRSLWQRFDAIHCMTARAIAELSTRIMNQKECWLENRSWKKTRKMCANWKYVNSLWMQYRLGWERIIDAIVGIYEWLATTVTISHRSRDSSNRKKQTTEFGILALVSIPQANRMCFVPLCVCVPIKVCQQTCSWRMSQKK